MLSNTYRLPLINMFNKCTMCSLKSVNKSKVLSVLFFIYLLNFFTKCEANLFNLKNIVDNVVPIKIDFHSVRKLYERQEEVNEAIRVLSEWKNDKTITEIISKISSAAVIIQDVIKEDFFFERTATKENMGDCKWDVSILINVYSCMKM